jgi:hypothetical protein
LRLELLEKRVLKALFHCGHIASNDNDDDDDDDNDDDGSCLLCFL